MTFFSTKTKTNEKTLTERTTCSPVALSELCIPVIWTKMKKLHLDFPSDKAMVIKPCVFNSNTVCGSKKQKLQFRICCFTDLHEM